MNRYRFRIETSSYLTLEHFLTSNRLAQIVTLPWSWQKSTNLVQCLSSKIQPNNKLGHQRMLPKNVFVLFYLYFHPSNRALICILRQTVKCLPNDAHKIYRERRIFLGRISSNIGQVHVKIGCLNFGVGPCKVGVKSTSVGVS